MKEELTYREEEIDGVNVLLPNVTLDSRPQDERTPLGKWGLARQNYLDKTGLIGLYYIQGNLYSHLEEIDQLARKWEEALTESLMNGENVPDRQSDPLAWVQYKNNLQSRVDELIRTGLIEV